MPIAREVKSEAQPRQYYYRNFVSNSNSAESSLRCNGVGRERVPLGEFGLHDFGIFRPREEFGSRGSYGALLETDPDLHLSRALRQDAAP